MMKSSIKFGDFCVHLQPQSQELNLPVSRVQISRLAIMFTADFPLRSHGRNCTKLLNLNGFQKLSHLLHLKRISMDFPACHCKDITVSVPFSRCIQRTKPLPLCYCFQQQPWQHTDTLAMPFANLCKTIHRQKPTDFSILEMDLD